MDEHQWLTSADPQAMLNFLIKRNTYTDKSPPIRIPSDRKLRLLAVAIARHGVGVTNRPIENIVEYERRIDEGGEFARTAIDSVHEEIDALRRVSLPGTNTEALIANLIREIAGNPFREAEVRRKCRRCGGHGRVPSGVYEMPSEPCPGCVRGRVSPSWLTPQVLTLARAAYLERAEEVCSKCKGTGDRHRCRTCQHVPRESRFIMSCSPDASLDCEPCHGTGRIETGHLDPLRLAVLADALEEAGCPVEVECPHCSEGAWRTRLGYLECSKCSGTARIANPILAHLRRECVPGMGTCDYHPHVRGCHVIDCLLGKE